MRLFLLGISAILCACGTPYQEMGFRGGVSADRMTDTTFRISARGNSHTSEANIQDYVLLKAAETTVKNGGTHFVVISAEDASRSNVLTFGGTSETTFRGNRAITTHSAPDQITVVRPGRDLFIRVLKLEPGHAPPAGTFAADEIIRHVGARARRS